MAASKCSSLEPERLGGRGCLPIRRGFLRRPTGARWIRHRCRKAPDMVRSTARPAIAVGRLAARGATEASGPAGAQRGAAALAGWRNAGTFATTPTPPLRGERLGGAPQLVSARVSPTDRLHAEIDQVFATGEPVLAGWGIDTDGQPVFVGLGTAASESGDAWGGFLTDPRRRGGAGRRPRGPAQVVQQPQPGGGHGEAAPATAGPVQDRPDQRGAAVLAGQPADDLHPAAGLAKGPLDEVGVPDPIPVLPGEAQVDGEVVAAVEQAAHRRRIGVAPAAGEAVDPVLDVPDRGRPGLDGVGHLEDRPICLLYTSDAADEEE